MVLESNLLFFELSLTRACSQMVTFKLSHTVLGNSVQFVMSKGQTETLWLSDGCQTRDVLHTGQMLLPLRYPP